MQTKTEAFAAELGDLAALFKALAHPARLAILEFLARQDTCVCGEIVEELPLAQATVSQHLKVLREAGLINVTQRGLTSCYCINPVEVERLRSDVERFLGNLKGIDAESCC